MNICPFVSHMLGDDSPNTLTLDEMSDKKPRRGNKKSDTIILGQSETSTATATREAPSSDSAASHLYCIKESCRFYAANTSECQFDQIHNLLQSVQESTDNMPEMDLTGLSKDIDKIWKFQTQSVAELVKSIGDSDKKRTNAFDALQKDVSKSVADCVESLGAGTESSEDNNVGSKIDSMDKKLDERHATLDDLSTTMSDLVLNLHESVSQLEEKTGKMFEQMARIDRSMSEDSTFRRVVEEVVSEHIGSIKQPDLSEPIKKIESKISDIKAPDYSKDLKKIETRLGELTDQKKSGDHEFEELKRESATHEVLRTQMAGWQSEVSDKLQDMKTQQKIWDERLREMSSQQDKLMTLLEESKQQRNKQESRSVQKEAKKFNNLGVTSFHNGAYEMARDQFLQAVKADADFAEAYNNLGLAYTELKMETDATEAFATAVKLDPELHAAYNNLGYIHFQNERYESAIEMYNEALNHSSDSGSAYTNLGNAHFKMDDKKKAREAWLKAIEIDPGNEKARMSLRQLDEEK